MNGSTILYNTLQKWTDKKDKHIGIIEVASDQKITYPELLSAIASLQEFFGENPQTIILAVSGSIANSAVWFTAMIFGHHLIPISPNTTEFEYKQLVKKYKPTFLITETDSWVTQPDAQQLTLRSIQLIIEKGIQNKTSFKNLNKPIDGTVYLETSGSTGTPKGMQLVTSQIVITADNIRRIHELTEEDRCLTPLPFYHVNAPVVSLVTSILSGSTVIIAPRFSVSHFWEWVEKYDPTWISIVPTIIAILLKFDKPKFLEKSSIRFVRTASAPLPKANLMKFEEKFDLPVIETYGISEGASTIFSNPLPPKKHKAGSVGLPLGVEAKIIDTQTKEKVKQGEIGEVCVKGTQIIDHYEESRDPESFSDGWFLTGDLGYFDKEGYLFLTGRKKEIIIRGGENISPREIEETLLMYPGIFEAAVVGQPDTILGEKVVAFLVVDKKPDSEFIDDIKYFAKTKLSPQKVPAEIYIVEELPRGKTNKIDKNALKKVFL